MSRETPKHAPRTRRPGERHWRVGAAVVVLLWLVVGGPLGSFAGRLAEVAENDNAAFLPESSESTLALQEFLGFVGTEDLPTTVVARRDGGLSEQDAALLAEYAAQIRTLEDVDASRVTEPIPAPGGAAAQIVVPVTATDGEEVSATVERIRTIVADPPDGLTVLVGGQGGILADFIVAFGAIDGLLLAVALTVVLIILVLVYRTVVLPLVVLFSAVLALGVSSAAVYWLTSNGAIDLNGQSQGILFILTVGAATDYSLLIVARFREELRDHESKVVAMRAAYRGAVEPIVASGATVILGLLCLLLSDLSSLSGLGPVGAIGVAGAMFSSLTLLPAALLLLGRSAYWPYRPQLGSEHGDRRGVWGRVARLVGRRHRAVWIGTTLALAFFAAFLPTLNEDPVPQTELFLTDVDSVAAQEILDEEFVSDQASPAQVLVPAGLVQEVVLTAASVPGVAENGVVPLPAGPPGPDAEPLVVDGRSAVLVTLDSPADSRQATETVRDLRAALDPLGEDILVGGTTAILLDTRETVDSDRRKVIPAILAVIFVVLALLLRSLVAPMVLLLANVLSFGATIGIAAILFNYVFGFPASDPSTLLIGFVFLVALGIDYSIFLMTRVREESLRQGTHPGILKGLSVTGGVITSAGVVLAATFAALSVLPLLFLVQIAFVVAFGVLLDTLVVRSLLVPALSYELGARVWWPSALARTPDHADADTSKMLHLGDADGVAGIPVDDASGPVPR